MLPENWQPLEEEVVYKNAWITLKRDRVRRPDGSEAEWGKLEIAPAVFMVPVNEKNEVYLMKQYRYPSREEFWEVSSGGSEGQDPLEAAKRELHEELSLQAETWTQLDVFWPYPAFSNERAFVFLAQQLSQVTNTNDLVEEGIRDVTPMPFTEAIRMIKEGEITHGATIVSLTLAALHLGILKM